MAQFRPSSVSAVTGEEHRWAVGTRRCAVGPLRPPRVGGRTPRRRCRRPNLFACSRSVKPRLGVPKSQRRPVCPAPGGATAAAGASAKSPGIAAEPLLRQKASRPLERAFAPRLAEPAELRRILQPGLGLCSCCSKSLRLLARGGGCHGGFKPPGPPPPHSSSASPALGPTAVPPAGTDAKKNRLASRGAGAGGSWRRRRLVMQHPRRAACPAPASPGAAQTGRLQRSRWDPASGGGSRASPGVAGDSCAGSHRGASVALGELPCFGGVTVPDGF